MPESRVVRKTILDAVIGLLSYSIANIAASEAVGIADKTTITPSMVSSAINNLKMSHTRIGNKMSLTNASG